MKISIEPTSIGSSDPKAVHTDSFTPIRRPGDGVNGDQQSTFGEWNYEQHNEPLTIMIGIEREELTVGIRLEELDVWGNDLILQG
jgi:hypothetical protein